MNSIFNKLEKLHDKYVPSYGKAKTVYGEILRAYMYIAYRFFNDGDMFFKRNGVESCGSDFLYLSEVIDPSIDNKLYMSIRRMRRDCPIDDDENQYKRMLIEVGKLLYAFLISKKAEYLKSKSNYIDSRSDFYKEAMDLWYEDDYYY